MTKTKIDEPIMDESVWRENFVCESKAEIPPVPTWREIAKVNFIEILGEREERYAIGL